MSVAVSEPDRPATTWPDRPRPFVAEDLFGMPDDGYRREIIDGMLVVSPSPVAAHQICIYQLAKRLEAAAPRHLQMMISPFDWTPPGGDSLQPDVLVARRGDINLRGRLRATPVLVVEVVSPSSVRMDKMIKRAAYERLGVPAYWIVDPDGPGLVALELNEAGRYVQTARAAGRRRFKVTVPFPLELIPADLLDG